MGKAMKVIVVENSAPTRKMLTLKLAQIAGMLVVAEAADEDSAVTAVLSHQPDLVTLDLGLDQGSGIGVLRRLRSAQFAGRIFVFSSEDRSLVGARCLEVGADRYFQKFNDDQALFEAVQDLRVAHERN